MQLFVVPGPCENGCFTSTGYCAVYSDLSCPIYTILLSKSDFSYALLLVTFVVEQSYIPLLKALMCGIIAVGAQGCGCIFTFCHAYLKMGVLLHKMASICKQTLMTVSISKNFKWRALGTLYWLDFNFKIQIPTYF